MPSVEDAAEAELSATAKKMLLPKATEDQLALDGSVRSVQVMPSVEDAAVVGLHCATATNVLLPKVTAFQSDLVGSVRNVQVMPSVEEAAEVESYATATNVLFP